MQKLLLSMLGMVVLNAVAFAILVLLWALFGNQEFIGDVLLSPEYRTDSAILNGSAADISAGITTSLLLSMLIAVLSGAGWLVGIWWAHLDSPGQIYRLRWLWNAALAVGLIVEACALGYLFFFDVAVLRPTVDIALWLLFLAVYFGCFLLSSIFTTPYIARPAVPFGAATLPS